MSFNFQYMLQMFGKTFQQQLHISVVQGKEWLLLEVLAPDIRDIWCQFSFQ
jgi:hypothetical protein